MPCKIHGDSCDGGCVDPNVDNGMMTKVWGPTGWLFLHCVTFGYPYAINLDNPEHATKREEYQHFFHLLGKVLPCRYCRDSYQEFMKENPIESNLNTRKDLCRWLYDIHNKVNHKLGVPNCQIPSFEQVQDRYEQFRAKCKKTTEDERVANINKGCIKPADGTPKKCVINIIPCNNGDVTRREGDSKFTSFFSDIKNNGNLTQFIVMSLISILAFVLNRKNLSNTQKNRRLRK